ncbi:hypothetical protein ANCCAN_14082 [Ancylostoma caninum]|uniref:Uncharacterized protein n=1 Tax=Ancylostoma caninum TaxID=29170 RepID=A0A368GAF5_ANCCA|nr:hypothetical protein ANCCAN_14082 [Ancylostoma caninum]
MRRSSLLLALLLPYTSAYIQNAICPQCAGGNAQYATGSYNGYANVDTNPLAYFNGPTDFGNQLGKAIAARINTDGYSSDSQSRMTFGSHPMSSYGSQSYGTQSYGGTPNYGSQTYVIQPDSQGSYTMSSYPGGYNQQQGMSSGGYGAQGYGTQGYGTQGYGTQGYGTQGYGSQGGYSMNSYPGGGYNQYGGQTMQSGNYNYGNMAASYGNMATGYGGNTNSFGSYPSGGYGIPDPITTGGMSSMPSSGGSCPYCFGNKGGYKAKKAKRESESTKVTKKESESTKKAKEELKPTKKN